MNSVLDTLQTWARAARTAATRSARPDIAPPTRRDPLAYRLKGWPDLPERQRTARVYRLMSTMSVRPVHRSYMLEQTRLAPAELDALLRRLDSDHVLEVVDTSGFGRGVPAAAELRA